MIQVDEQVVTRIAAAIDERRLVDLLTSAINTPSPTGHEGAMAELMAVEMAKAGMEVRVQEVEEGRANAMGMMAGSHNGPCLMFNGHIDTSYSGDEPWLTGIGFKPEATVRERRIYGLGAANMKAAVCAYVEAVNALRDAGLSLAGDLVVAAVAGEIEKAQWPGSPLSTGKDFRGYSTGSRFLVTHGGTADVCVIGEPTEHRIVLGHYGTCWMRISTHGPFIHTAFTTGRLQENAIVRMRTVLDVVLDWIPSWVSETAYMGEPGIVNIGALDSGLPWRLSRTPQRADLFLDVRVPPTMSIPEARSELRSLVADLQERFPDYGIDWELYVTVPGAEIDADHPIVEALAHSHHRVFGREPDRTSVRWGSDASVLTRYGIPTVNYGTSSGLPGPDGENVLVDDVVALANVYALTAAAVCGIS